MVVKRYYVYIMSNFSKTLYIGVTSDLEKRVYEHKLKLIEGFTKKYNMTKLVYFEETNDVEVAIEREKQIKGWLRKKKVALIESVNPEWKDLTSDSSPACGRAQNDTAQVSSDLSSSTLYPKPSTLTYK